MVVTEATWEWHRRGCLGVYSVGSVMRHVHAGVHVQVARCFVV